MYRDMRDFLAALEAKGKLRRIQKEVDHTWELACLARWMFQALPEAERFGMLFERVKGFKIPVMTAVLGKPVKCVRTDYDAYKQQFIGRGMSEEMAQGMTDMMRAKSEGLDNGEVRTRENTTQTGFRQWCEGVLKPAVTG